MDYIMGIDVGTSNVKAVLFDEKGTEIQVASRVSETINDGGNNEEQDMTLVWEKVKAGIPSSKVKSSCSRRYQRYRSYRTGRRMLADRQRRKAVAECNSLV